MRKWLGLVLIAVILVAGGYYAIVARRGAQPPAGGNPPPALNNPSADSGANSDQSAPPGGNQGAAPQDPAAPAAPDFNLPDLSGSQVSLSQLRGSAVILNFWSTNCPYCRTELETLHRFYQEYGSKGIKVVTVNVLQRETPESVKSYVDKHGYRFPVLLDTKGEASFAYQVSFIPATLVIDGQGRVHQAKTGPVSYGELVQWVQGLTP